MSDNWKIEIETDLNTEQAEKKLKDLIGKYDGNNPIEIKVDIEGAEKAESLAKALKDINSLSKKLGNVKIKFDTGTSDNVGEQLGDNIKDNIEKASESADKIGENIEKAMSKSEKVAQEKLQKIKEGFKEIDKTMENMSAMDFISDGDAKRLDAYKEKLQSLKDTNFEDLDNKGLQKMIEKIGRVQSGLDKINTNNIKNEFQTAYVDDFVDKMRHIRDVMNAKSMNLEGIDALIDKAKKLNKSSKDINEMAEEFVKLRRSLKEDITVPLDLNSITSTETAFKAIAKYKEKLQDKLSMTVDANEVNQLQEQLNHVNGLLTKLKRETDEIGKTSELNIIDASQEKITEQMSKNVDKLSSSLNKVEKQIDKMKNSRFVDFDELTQAEEKAQALRNAIDNINKADLKPKGVQQFASQLEEVSDAVDKIASDINTAEMKEKFDLDLQDVIREANGLKSALIAVGASTSSIDNLINSLEELKSESNLDKARNELEGFKNEFENLANASDNLGNTNGGLTQYIQLLDKMTKAQKNFLNSTNETSANHFQAQIERYQNALENLKGTFNEVEQAQAEMLRKNAEIGLADSIEKELTRADKSLTTFIKNLNKIGAGSSFEKLTMEGGQLSAQFNELTQKASTLRNQLRNALDMGNVDVTEVRRLTEEINQVDNSLDNLRREAIRINCEEAIANLNELRNHAEKTQETIDQIDNMTLRLNSIGSQLDNGSMDFSQAEQTLRATVKEANNLENALDRVGRSARSSSNEVEQSGSRIGRAFDSIKDAFSTITIGELMEEGIEEAVYSIKEVITGLDSALAEFARVAPDNFSINDGNLKEVSQLAKGIAIDVGQSVEDVIVGMSTALQAGATTIEQASAIAEKSAILQNVSDMSAEHASEAVASMINQYYSMSEALSQSQSEVGKNIQGYNNLTEAMDLANYAGNNYAISTEGVVEALKRGGSTLSNYGISVADSMAMIAGANESLQDPERVGNGLKSIAINLAGLKTSTKDGSIELNKTALALKKIAGIDIFTDSSKTSVKDMVTIIDEVKGKWGELNETQQLGLSEAIAGKTQSSVFNALMSGWDRVKQFQQEYKDGFTVGSAERENAIYLDSIAGKWNTLKENMKSLVTNNISSSFVKDLLEGLNKVVLVVDKVSTGLGKIGSIGAIAGIASFIKTMANFDDFAKLDFTSQLGMFGKLSNAFTSLSGAMAGGNFKGGISAIVSGLKNMVAQSGLATVAMGALKAVLTGFAVAGVVAGIVAIGKALYDNIHKTEQTIETSKELQQNIQDEITTLNTQKTSLSQIATEYDKLSRKSNKTVEEMQRLSELKKQIAEIAPDLVVGYDANNDPILALKGSLTSYIAELDVAIDKQKDLYNTETYVQASAIMEENAKSMETWNTHLVKAGGSFELWQNQVDEASGKVVSSGKSLIKMSEQIAEADNHKKEVMLENLASISRQQQENAERDATVQQHYLNQWVKNTQLTSEQAKQAFSNFFTTLDWGTFDEAGATELSMGLKKLESVTATTTSAMGQKFQDMTAKANKAFKDTGAIQTYGKALQEIALDSGKFDMASWSNYLNEVNQRFQDGVMPVEQYQHALKYMADTLGDLTGIDAGTWLQSLIGTGDYASAFENMNSGLTKFLGSYKKTVGDIRSGDSLAMALKDQFNALEGFNAQLNRRIEADIPITVDWLIEQKDDLPKQVQTLIDAVTADGKVTEIEEKILLALTTELQNEGQISNDILTTLNDVIHGTLDGYNLDAKIEIGGVEFTIRQLQSLVGEAETTKEALDKLKGLDFENDGAEELKTTIEEVKEALNGIDSTHIRVAMDAQGFEKKEEIEMMSEAIEQIDGKEAKTQFIADTADYFKGASSVEEAIASLPPEIKLRYHIGVEGDEYLEGLDAKLKALPPEIQTMITVDGTYSLHDLEEIKAMCDVLGNETVTMLLSLEGAPEALADCSSLEERLQTLAELVATSGVELENGDEVIDKIDAIVKELKKADETEANPKVDVESDDEELEETKEKIDAVDGKNTESNHKANADGEEVEETKEKTDDLDGKQTQSNHTAKSEDSELDETKEKIEKLTQDTHGKITVHADKREVVEAQIDKDRLEVDGKAITRVQVDGMGYYDVAINDKGQLEVNGKAITNVEVNNGEQLKFAINDKGQLEVNGIALTNVDILGSEKLVTAKQEKEELEKDGEANTKVNVDDNDYQKTKAELAQGTETEVRFTLKQTIDSILAKLGLNKSEANVIINIECNDQATHILSNIKNTYGNINCKINVESSTATNAEQTLGRLAGKTIPTKTLTVTVSSLDNALSKMDSLATKTIPSKTFSVTANNLASTTQQVAELSARTIANKSFSVTCNSQSATSSLSYLANAKVPSKSFSITCNASGATSALNSVRSASIPNKTFTISCSDNASSKVNKVKGAKISNKSFTISATDRASGTIASIKRQLAGISGKTVTVTVRKNTIYTTNGTGAGTGYVSVGEPRVANNVSTLNNAVKLADASGNALGTQVSAMAEGTSGMVSAMAKAKANIDTGLTRKALKYNVDLLKNMDAILSKIQANLDKVNAKQELAFGNSKAKLLKEEISLLTKQQNLTSTNIKNMQGMAGKLKSSLKNMGFKFKDDGSISNYNKKIVAMEEKVAKLKSTAEKSEKTASKDKATKKQKSKATSDKKAYEKAQAELDKMKQYTDEYLDLTMNQIPEAQAEWYELKNAIAQANAEMITAKKEAKTLSEDLTIDVQTRYSDRRNSLASLDEAKADLTDDVSEKIKHLKNANKDYENELNRQQDLIGTYKSRMKDNRGILKNYGFKFEDDGTTKNSASNLEKLKKSMSPAEYEAIYAIWDEYMNDLTSNLPNAQQEVIDLNQAMKDNKEEIADLNKQLKELNEEAQDLQLTSAYDRLSDSLDLVEAKMEGAFGGKKIAYLQEQVTITKDLRKQTQKLQEESKGDMNDAKKSLKNYGIKFDENNNMTNLQSIVSKTDDLAKKEAILELAKAYEEARQNVRDYQLEAVELENQQRELKDAILEIRYELEQLADDAWARELENDLKIIQNELEIVQGLADLNGTNTFDNLEHQAELYRKLIQETQQDLIDYQNKSDKYALDLTRYGFKIEDDGTIDNMDEQLLKLKNSLSDTEFSHVQDLLDNYFEYAIDKTHDAEKSLIDYQKAIEDIEQQKLEATKDIEEEITKMIEKQVEDRINEIEKEKEARIEALDEAQKAYQRWRDEAKYEDDYNKQLEKVNQLEAEIEIAKRDTSLAGQKRLADLMEQLKDEQENLEDLVEDKIDEDINNMFDDEKDRIEKTSEQEIENLKELWSAQNIAEAVSQALSSGIFTDIDGNIMQLDEALLEFANNSEEYLGVMGQTMKEQLLDNLNVALQTMSEMKDIYTTLGNGEYGITLMPMVDGDIIDTAGTGAVRTETTNNVSVGDMSIVIQGSADAQTVGQIEALLNEYKSEIYGEILKNMK